MDQRTKNRDIVAVAPPVKQQDIDNRVVAMPRVSRFRFSARTSSSFLLKSNRNIQRH